jgi:hypothetical protein
VSTLAIRQAFEQRLATLLPVIDTAYENVAFVPALDTTPYQESYLIPATPDNSVLSGHYVREMGIFQVAVMYPLMVGVGDAEARVAAIVALFPRGLVMTNVGITITVEATPAVAHGFRDRDRWRVPVSVRYRAEIFS